MFTKPRQPGLSFNVFFTIALIVIAILAISDIPEMLARKRGPKSTTAVQKPVVIPAQQLTREERSTVDVFKRSAPSVVSVANKALVRDFWGLRVYEVQRGMGSGFIWDKDGHLVSNFHVIEGASTIQVTLRDGNTYDAKLVGADPDHDLAVLKINAPADALVPVTIGTSGDLQVGQTVLAIGNPFGLDCSLSAGVVSSVGRSMKSISGITMDDIIQTDAAINSGNSGGPLLDTAGRLVGINTAIISPSGGSVGLGFAIPVDRAAEVVPQLIAYGKVKRVGLGITLFPDSLARRYGIKGAIIRRVYKNGAAEQAGLRGTADDRVGDIILGIDSETITSVIELREALIRKKKGDTVDVVYLRGNRKSKVTCTLRALD